MRDCTRALILKHAEKIGATVITLDVANEGIEQAKGYMAEAMKTGNLKDMIADLTGKTDADRFRVGRACGADRQPFPLTRITFHLNTQTRRVMGKSLPIFNGPSDTVGSFSNRLLSSSPPFQRETDRYDGRTVDDFKPYLIALNLTKRCNLKCDHCYLDATTKAAGGDDELSTEECYRLIDQIAEVNKGCLLVITGGEPLVRPDILDIARYAVKLGFMVVFGTNGMLINDQLAKTLSRSG